MVYGDSCPCHRDFTEMAVPTVSFYQKPYGHFPI